MPIKATTFMEAERALRKVGRLLTYQIWQQWFHAERELAMTWADQIYRGNGIEQPYHVKPLVTAPRWSDCYGKIWKRGELPPEKIDADFENDDLSSKRKRPRSGREGKA